MHGKVLYRMRTKQREMYKQLFHKKKKKGHVNYVTVKYWLFKNILGGICNYIFLFSNTIFLKSIH